MAQLALFEGSHLPRTAAREALSQGDLDEAHAQLERLAGATEEAVDAARLERIISTLGAAREDPVGTVHDAFASALAKVEPRGFLTDREWFALYARHVASALDAEPGSCFRGWLGAHFAFAAGDMDGARRAATRIVESQPPGPAWIEAARLAFELGEASSAGEWIHAACLESRIELAAAPPALERCGVPALDASPSLPAAPRAGRGPLRRSACSARPPRPIDALGRGPGRDRPRSGSAEPGRGRASRRDRSRRRRARRRRGPCLPRRAARGAALARARSPPRSRALQRPRAPRPPPHAAPGPRPARALPARAPRDPVLTAELPSLGSFRGTRAAAQLKQAAEDVPPALKHSFRCSLRRSEAAPVARRSRDSHDTDGSDIRSVGDERGARGPEPIGQRPELGTVATHLRHAGQQVEGPQEIAIDSLGDESAVAFLDLEEDVLEVSFGRSRELVSRSHSPLRSRSSIRRRTSPTASSPSRSSPRSSAATPSAIWAHSSSR